MAVAAPAPPRLDMGKKKPKVTLYVDIETPLKQRMERMAELNGRKLNSEVSRALEYYLKDHEPKDEPEARKK